jgi:suppressor of ftsI
MNGLVRRSPWVLVLGLLSSSACDGDSDQPKDAPLMFQPRLPFHEPAEIVSSNGVLEGTITSAPTKLMISGAAVNGESYNGAFVGPTLRLEPGDQIRLTLVNQLQQMTNIHFHGFHVSPSGMSDNVLRHVAVGETASYVIDVPATHDQGLFWYHSHMHMDSESQVFQGLSATIVIGDVRRLLPERFRSVPRRLLALKDLQVENGAIIAANIDSNAPTTRTVNGLVEPVIEVFPGATELWQIANISADIFYDVEIEGLTFLVVGEDGNPVEATFERQHLVMPPGKRFEALVTFANEGEVLFKTRAYDQGGDMYPETPLAHVALSGTPLAPIDPLGVDVALAPPSDLLDRPVVARRTWTFTEDDVLSLFYINGRQFDHDRVDVSPKLGTVEEWTLVNMTLEQHPFHIHINDFKVISVGGQPYDAKGEQDTVILDPMSPVVIRAPFDDFTGKYVFHCHILNHEDNGMMALVDVVP